jgi:DNA-binding response OmpR family regulator
MPFSILVVEDDLNVRLLLKDLLEEQGYKVYEAANGVAGLKQFNLLQPDLVLLDISMPRLDGLAVLKEIRRQNATVGVLVISAMIANSVVAEARAYEVDGYLHKPFRLETLLAEVQRVRTLVHSRRSAGLIGAQFAFGLLGTPERNLHKETSARSEA